jgi:hypothetical protein
LVIDTLKKQANFKNIGVSYFYCDYGVESAQSFAPSILKQLLMQLSPLPQVVLDFYELYRRVGFPRSQAEVSQVIRKLSSHFDTCFIVIDALDESDVHSQRQEILKVLTSLEVSTIRIFITSRPHETDIRIALQDASKIEAKAREADIKAYLTQKLENAPRLSKITDEQLRSQIITDISTRAQGM